MGGLTVAGFEAFPGGGPARGAVERDVEAELFEKVARHRDHERGAVGERQEGDFQGGEGHAGRVSGRAERRGGSETSPAPERAAQVGISL